MMAREYERGFASLLGLVMALAVMGMGISVYYAASSSYEAVQESVLELRLRQLSESILEEQSAQLHSDPRILQELPADGREKSLISAQAAEDDMYVSVFARKAEAGRYLLLAEAWRGPDHQDRCCRSIVCLRQDETGQIVVDHWEMNNR
jgi:hypothetical protein